MNTAQTESEPQCNHDATTDATDVAPEVWRGLGAQTAAAEGDPDDEHLPPEMEPLLAGGVVEEVAAAGKAAKASLTGTQQAKQKALDELIQRKVATRDRAGRIARLIAARKLNGWDQEEAARRLGYSNGTQLSLLESGAREIRLDHVVKFSEVLGVSTDYLLGRASSESEIEIRTSVAGRVLDGVKAVADSLVRQIEASDKFAGGPALPRYRALLEHTRAVMSAARRVDGPALHAVAGGATLEYAIHQLQDVVVEGARAVAGFENEVQSLRDLLRTPAANDATAMDISSTA